ncbi:glycosyltransferase family 2 protein [Candidatus Falkowbacteria bacterium]|nr:glycosyltransferase family 2 protein [Candidatus Falkowbacteria bacterium]
MKISKLSIVIPAYNEEKTLEGILGKVEAANFGHVEKEIIIIDDGSGDKTREILKKYENKYRVIYHDKNMGKGAAVRTGFGAATGDYVVVQDADLEYDPNDIAVMVKLAAEKDAGVVYGSRRLGLLKKKNPMAGWVYHLGGRFLTLFANFLYGISITDEPTCYKMVSRRIIDRMELEANGFEFCPEITAKIARLGVPIHEVPISYNPRSVKEGKKIKFKDGLIAIWTLIKYRFKKI